MTKKIRLKKLHDNAKIPVYGSKEAAGADLYACMAEPISIGPGETKMIHTGIAVEIPDGCVGLIYARSGLATKKGVAPANKVGVIDSDYRGEILVGLFNHSKEAFIVEPEERVAQMVITPYIRAEYEEVQSLMETQRGQGGFGSTGR